MLGSGIYLIQLWELKLISNSDMGAFYKVVNRRKQSKRGSQPLGDVKTSNWVFTKKCHFRKRGDDLD